MINSWLRLNPLNECTINVSCQVCKFTPSYYYICTILSPNITDNITTGSGMLYGDTSKFRSEVEV